jgi:hypothetical protein
VSESTGDSAWVYATSDQFRGGVVPKLVIGGDAEPVGQTLVPLRHPIRSQERRSICSAGEHERGWWQFEPQRRRAGAATLEMLAQHDNGLRIEGNPPLLMGLELGLNQRPCSVRIACRSQIVSLPFSRLTADHRMAQTSPRRAPVVIVDHTNAPQSGSLQAAFTIRAASAGVGGCGFGLGAAGGVA